VIKNPFNSLLHGKMRLMQLLPKIVALEKAVNDKADIARVIDLRKYSMSKQATPPILVDAEKRVKISPHGLELFKLRFARVLSYKVSGEAPPRPAKCIRGCAPGMCAREAAASPSADSPAEAAASAAASDVYCYECVPMPPARRFFFVQFEHGGASMADDAADEQPIESAELAALDYGADTSLEDRYTRHVVCEDWCSCNSPAHDGLPCVHMLRLWIQLNLARVPDGAVHRRWAARIGDEEDLLARARRAQRFRLDAQQTARHELAASGGVKKALSQHEQYLSLTSKGKVLFSAAARDPAMAAAVHNILNAALTQLADGDLGKQQTHGRKQAAAARRKTDETAAGRDRAAESGGAGGGASAPASEPAEQVVVPNAKTSASCKRRYTAGTGMRASGNKKAKHAGGKK